MYVKTVRLWLLFLFVASLVVHVGVFAYSYLKGAIYADDFEALTLQILAVYSIPLGVSLGAFFGQGDPKETRADPSASYTALALSILWNGLLLARSLIFGFAQEDFIGDFTGFLKNTSAASTFLIGGALAFFFAKKGAADEPVKDTSTRGSDTPSG